MKACVVSDLHGSFHRYEALFGWIETNIPDVVFIAGDILPYTSIIHHPEQGIIEDFLLDYIGPHLHELKQKMGDSYPTIYAILGNDDPRSNETSMLQLDNEGLLLYAHKRVFENDYGTVFGYSYVPPTPFQIKDWERYDVSRYIHPYDISPEQGVRTVEVDPHRIRSATIRKDLEELTSGYSMDKAIFLFHAPPYNTHLDRAALDGIIVNQIPVDVHAGSIAIERFIDTRQPCITFHGHIHESSRITGHWREQLGRTWMFNASTDEHGLRLIHMNLKSPNQAERILL